MPRINKRHSGVFRDGKFHADNPTELKNDILSMNGKAGYLVCLPYKKMKTNEQNKYYRGIVIQILADYFGYSNEECHQAISLQFLKYQPNPKAPPIVKSTKLSEWSTDEWEDYMSHIRIWSANTYGLHIPEPNECDLSQIKDIYY